METISQAALAESLSGIWSALHDDAPFAISDGELHYLRGIALSLDDDIVSHMLLKKIRLAEVHDAGSLASVVTMNSFVEYRFDGGEKRFRQLVHPTSSNAGYGLSVGSLEGAGLLAMRSGQTILWPNAHGTLADLHVLHVESRAGPGVGRRHIADGGNV
ncbi:transcription elongation factor GreAB [Sphingomonas parva]|uniref:Transcription elongation factor GreAB n=1 Tax=Sphingomonas parva TaxID=2555898 RepID=A0A4Y8ZTC0_9SPHN|nr:transcription elongation factor GreAB [Sphingomonas parva]TFI58009.1 transcription elongation factor GreAB [Sphingomonas parva]